MSDLRPSMAAACRRRELIDIARRCQLPLSLRERDRDRIVAEAALLNHAARLGVKARDLAELQTLALSEVGLVPGPGPAYL